MTHSEQMPGAELEQLIQRGMNGESLDVIGAMLRTQLVIPSGGAVGPNFEGFDPVLFDRAGTPMLAVFTSLERTSTVTRVARYALTMSGRDLVLRMSGGHGIVVNPGHELGFEILPEAVATIVGRLREGA